jgi:hypothetical protein
MPSMTSDLDVFTYAELSALHAAASLRAVELAEQMCAMLDDCPAALLRGRLADAQVILAAAREQQALARRLTAAMYERDGA